MLAEADENFVAARRYLAICSHSVKEVDNHASPGKVETANAQIAMCVCLRLCWIARDDLGPEVIIISETIVMYDRHRYVT